MKKGIPEDFVDSLELELLKLKLDEAALIDDLKVDKESTQDEYPEEVTEQKLAIKDVQFMKLKVIDFRVTSNA